MRHHGSGARCTSSCGQLPEMGSQFGVRRDPADNVLYVTVGRPFGRAPYGPS